MDLKSCILRNSLPEIEYTNWTKSTYGSFDESEFLKDMAASNLTLPIKNDTYFITLDHINGFIGAYDFTQSIKSFRLLMHVWSSLIPSKALKNELFRIKRSLPPYYWVIHIRLEGDAVRYMNDGENGDDIKFKRYLKKALTGITGSQCYIDYLLTRSDDRTVRLPPVYLISGIFQNNVNSFLHTRAIFVYNALRKLGFEKIYSSISDQQSIILHNNTFVTGNITTLTTNLTSSKFTFPEQQALIDFYMGIQAPCFVSNHEKLMWSSFSYFIIKFRKLKKLRKMHIDQEMLDDFCSDDPYTSLCLNWGL